MTIAQDPANHLAQFNIADPRFPLDDPRMAGFTSRLDAINALADAAPGFVWRLVADGGNDATSLHYPGLGNKIVNFSVWESREALWDYVYRSPHLDLLRQRAEWFDLPAGDHLVLWWVAAGHTPTVDEAVERLERLHRDGPTPAAFTFRHFFPAVAPVDDSGVTKAVAPGSPR